MTAMKGIPPNYLLVDIPEDKEPTEFSTDERRADILVNVIFEHGHPYAVSQAKLAKRYGVTQQSISTDIKVLGSFMGQQNLQEYAFTLTQATFERVHRNLRERGDDKDLFRVTLDWNKWLEDRGAITQQPKTINVEHRLKDMSLEELLEVLDESHEDGEEEGEG